MLVLTTFELDEYVFGALRAGASGFLLKGGQPGDLLAAIRLVAALIDLNSRPHYLHSGWFLISVANLVVILAMIAVFLLALVIPFPRDRSKQ